VAAARASMVVTGVSVARASTMTTAVVNGLGG
jgi:hypothetical protein